VIIISSHAVPYKRNQRWERIMKFMNKNAGEGGDPGMRAALEVIAPISNYWRNYFNKNHRLLSTEAAIIPELGVSLPQLGFAKFNRGMQDSFDSYRALNWKKATEGHADPFKLQDDYYLQFYKEFFKLHARKELSDDGTTSKEFAEYLDKRSVTVQMIESTELANPLDYLILRSRMDNDIHSFVTGKIVGAKDYDGNTFSMDNVKPSRILMDNPIYKLLGGPGYFRGISLDPPARSNKYDINAIREFGKQAHTLLTESPSDGKVSKTIARWKIACEKGAK
jgi:hypothetical protein